MERIKTTHLNYVPQLGYGNPDVEAGRLIMAGKTAEECAASLPTSHLIPQGLLAFQIVSVVFSCNITANNAKNPWVKWARESSNNLAWLALFSYKSLVRAKGGNYSLIYSCDDREMLTDLRDRMWTKYTKIKSYNYAVDYNKKLEDNGVIDEDNPDYPMTIKSVAITKNYNMYEFLSKVGRFDNPDYYISVQPSCNVPVVMKKKLKRSPFPRVIEESSRFFGMHTDQMFSRYIAEELTNGDRTRFNKSPSTLVNYYLVEKETNPNINLLEK